MHPLEIEHLLGLELKEEPTMERLMTSKSRNTYVCDKDGMVIGLNICSKDLSSITIPADLKYLRYLNVSENRALLELIFETGLPSLEKLDASECSLEEFSLPSGFKELHTVYVQQNQLVKFTIEGECPNLTYLDLTGNQLKEILLPAELPKLELLYLQGGNKVKEISFLARANALQALNLSGNEVFDLSPLKHLIEKGVSVQLKKTGSGILVEGCPLTTPPPELVQQGREALLNYFRELTLNSTDRIREVKMLILGEGGAGKTSLVIRLKEGMEASLPDETDSTKGIDIYDYPFTVDQDDSFKINIWDFGGQEIYHATHQFFLTKRSLYVLVTDARKEDTDFDYWLQIIELLSDNSPVLVLQNQKGGRKKDINEVGLRRQFSNIKEFFHFDLKYDEETLRKFKIEIEYHVQKLPHVNEVLPRVWVDIRKEINVLKKEGRHFITEYQYFELCRKHGLEEERAEFLSQYLHDLGIFLHFQEDPILKRWVFLENEWVTGGVYAVLDNNRVIEQKGRFSRKNAVDIWTRHYYKHLHNELLQLMTKFELCYRIPNVEKEEYIAPQLLPANEPQLAWNTKNNLQLRYHYRFMPKGLLSRFIVRMHRYIRDVGAEAWKKGIVLHRQGAQAKVVETYGTRSIQVHVKGNNARELLTLINKEFDRLHSSYHKLQVKKMIPCNCSVCMSLGEPNFYEYTNLIHRKDREKTTVECTISFENVNVLRLIDNVFATTFFKPKLFPLRVSISYSKNDVEHLEGLRKQLSVLQRQDVLFSWDDTKLLPGEEWDNRIKRELTAAELIIILVSPDLLATDYIWNIEMKAALDRHNRGEALVVPVIVRPCLWKNTPLAKITALPMNGKPITSWSNKDEAWEYVARKLEELAGIFKKNL